VLSLLVAAIPAFIQAFAQSAGTAAGAAFIQGLIPKPKPPEQMTAELAQANQSLGEALNRINKPTPNVDELWHVGDAMTAVAAKNPDYLAQSEAVLKSFSPTSYDFAKQLQETLHPVITKSPDIQSLLDSIGPKSTQPSSAQPFVLPQIKTVPLPDQIKTVPWPQTTQFVWPAPFSLSTAPGNFQWPGQEK